MRSPLLSVVLILWVALPCWAAAPSRTYTYTTGNTIDPSQVTTNEDNIFSYLQAGVDTYAVGTVNAAAIGDNAVGASEIASGAVDVVDMATTGTAADDKVFIADSATAGTWRTISNCTSATSALRYTQSSNGFSCGTIAADVGGTNATRVHRTSGDVSTTSTSLVNFTGASITITTAADPVLVGFAGPCRNDNVNAVVYFGVQIDSTTNVLGTTGIEMNAAVASEHMDCSFTVMTPALTAASHTINLQWAVSAGTGLVSCGANNPCQFWVTEVVSS